MANRISELLMQQDPVLTGIAQGYGNSSYVAGELFPDVTVEKEHVKVPTFGKENMRVYTTERALRGASNEITPDGIPLTNITLKEHDLSFPIDYREKQTAKGIFDLEKYAAQNVADAMLLKREYLTASLVQNPSNFGANTTALSGTSQWSNAASDPIAAIFTARDAVRATSGMYPNVLLLGASAYVTLQNHAKTLARIQYSQVGVLTTDLLATILNIDKVVIGQSVYADKTSATFTDVWGDNAILAYVPQTGRAQRSQYTPSFGYTFILNNFPSIDRYEMPGGKVSYVRGTTLMAPSLLSSGSGYLFTNCV